jgi:hypothetical protein
LVDLRVSGAPQDLCGVWGRGLVLAKYPGDVVRDLGILVMQLDRASIVYEQAIRRLGAALLPDTA